MKKSYLSKLLIILISVVTCTTEPTIEEALLNTEEITFEVEISSSEGGSVNVSSGNYTEGSVLTITASPREGYVFSNWEGFDSSNPEITINVNQEFNLKALFIPEEKAPLDQNLVTENIQIEGATEFQGEPTSNSNILFEMQNEKNLLAVVDNGFNIDLEIPAEIEGAFIQFTNEEGDLADSFLSIPRYSNSSKPEMTVTKRKNKNKDFDAKGINSDYFNIEVDFNENISAGVICLNVYVYEGNNVSYPIEICITINGFGGGPEGIIGKWQYFKSGYEGEELYDWSDEYEFQGEDVNGDGVIDDNDNLYIVYCYPEGEDGNYEEYSGSVTLAGVENLDYIVLNEDGSYEDRYELIINDPPLVEGSIEECLDDEYDGEIFKYANEFYPTTIADTYYGKWSYDENTNTIGLFDYSNATLDYEGSIFETSEDIFDEPYSYFDSGTFVELEGDILTLKEPSSYSSDVRITIFKRLD